MSKFATNANARLALIKESQFGTTPATPQLISQRFASSGFQLSRQELLDSSKSDRREYLYTMAGNNSFAGSVDSPFAHDNFDTLLESAMFNTFDANVLALGDDLQSFTLEEAQPDKNIFKVYNGVVCNGFTLNSPAEGLSTISFDMLGLGEQINSATISEAAYTAQPLRQPFTHCGGTISEGGAPIGYVNSVSLTLSNNLENAYVWGQCSPEDLIPNRVDITGSLVVYIQDTVLLNKFRNDTESSLSFTLDDGDDNTLTFNVPRIKYVSADTPITDATSRLLTLNFRGLYDGGVGAAMTITRSA